MAASILTGTMGWSYDDWRGVFFERETKQERLLETYSGLFPTVEIDSSFYGVPRATTLSGWRKQTPPGFLFSLKVPRAITHEKRLIGATESAFEFGALLEAQMGDRLGGILFQLPPDFTANDRRFLEPFADSLYSLRGLPHLPWAFEFRHESWKTTDAPRMLVERGAMVVTTEKHDWQSPGLPLRYLRLLGDEGSVARFDSVQIDRETEITDWAARLEEAQNLPDAPENIFVYVRNFYAGYAPGTIFTLREKLGMANPVVPSSMQMSLF